VALSLRFSRGLQPHSLGIFSEVGIDEAISRRDAIKSLVAQGINPSTWRKLRKAKDKARINELEARIDADRKALLSDPEVQVGIHEEGVIEIAKGRAMVRLSHEEAVYAQSLLEELIRSDSRFMAKYGAKNLELRGNRG